MRLLLASSGALSILALACGDSASSGGAGGGAGAGSSTGATTGVGGMIEPPPPPDSCVAPIAAAPIDAPTATVGSGAGTCTEAALDAALAGGGTIVFDCGDAPTTITLTTPKVITQTTVVDGGGLVTLSGGGTTRIFLVESEVDLTVQNITLADASVTGPRDAGPAPGNSGAAIFRHSASKLHVIGVTFTNNHSTDTGADIGGGAIYSYGGDTVVTGSTFDGNTAASGGAIGNLRSNLAIYNSSFANNQAVTGNGGAISLDGVNADQGKVFTLCGVVAKNNRAFHEGGAVFRYGYPDETTVIDSTTLDGNFVDDPSGSSHGGGLYHHTDTPGAMPLTMTNSTISNNTSATGAGGVFFYGSPVSLTNVTIANNVALGSLAGGIAAGGVTGTLKNCTIAGNHADDTDSFAGAMIGSSGLTLVNTIVANNTAGNEYNPVSCTEQAAGGDHDLQFPAQNGSGQAEPPCVPGVTFADPLLGPLADNGGPTFTMALLAGSPAVGAGADCPALDQRGVARSDGCDIGAYQHDP